MFEDVFKKQRPRRFEPKYQFYTPPKDDDKRIHFRRIRKSERGTKSSLLRLVVLFIILFMVFLYLFKRGERPRVESSSENDVIIVEEIIVVD
ncbi:hypothetical protein JW935_03460 [candidate division KSB1 bacterium]|nr:hypothetical protein [candidate division KSB1 bacterium]